MSYGLFSEKTIRNELICEYEFDLRNTYEEII